MTTPTPALGARLVTTFRADQLEPIVRNILQCLDAAKHFRERGDVLAERSELGEHYETQARNQLHDLLCEVVS